MNRVEALEELARLERRVRAVRTDMERDPHRVEQEHLRSVTPWLEKRKRLDAKFFRAEALLREYEARIAELKEEARTLVEQDRVKKLLDLIKRINKLSPGAVEAFVSERQLTREHLVDVRGLIRAYENEMDVIRSLTRGETYAKRRAELTRAIDAQARRWDEFCDHVLRGQQILDECHDRIAELRRIEPGLRSGGTIQKLEKTMSAIEELMSQLSPEAIRYALSR